MFGASCNQLLHSVLSNGEEVEIYFDRFRIVTYICNAIACLSFFQNGCYLPQLKNRFYYVINKHR